MMDIGTRQVLKEATKLLIEEHHHRVPVTRRVLGRLAAQYPEVVPTRRLGPRLAMWAPDMPATVARIYAAELDRKLRGALQ
jgi:hypothetical protein